MLVLLQAWWSSISRPLLLRGLLERCCSAPAKKPVTCACATQRVRLPRRSAARGEGPLACLALDCLPNPCKASQACHPPDPSPLQEESQVAALDPKADLAGDQLTVIKPPMIPRLRTSLDGSSPVAAPAARSSPKPARRTGAIGAYRATPLAAGGTRLNLASPNSGRAVLGRRCCLMAVIVTYSDGVMALHTA